MAEPPIDQSDYLRGAAQYLAQTIRGRRALRKLSECIDDEFSGLDHRNQAALFALLHASWGAYAGTTREVIHQTLTGESP